MVKKYFNNYKKLRGKVASLFFLVGAIAVFFSCTKTKPTEIINFFTVSGKVQNIIDSSTINNISVKLQDRNSFSTITDINGKFVFNNLLADNYILEITDTSFLPFKFHLNVNQDTSLTFFLTPVLGYNYFPLTLNDTLKFNYKRTFHFSYPPNPVYEICRLNWIGMNREKIRNTIIYTIKGTLIGKKIELWWNDNKYYYDTTYSKINREFSFLIKEYKDKTEFVQNTEDLAVYIDPHLFTTKFSYNKGVLLKVIDDNYYHHKLYLRLNQGLDYYYNQSGGGNNWDEIELKRIY